MAIDPPADREKSTSVKDGIHSEDADSSTGSLTYDVYSSDERVRKLSSSSSRILAHSSGDDWDPSEYHNHRVIREPHCLSSEVNPSSITIDESSTSLANCSLSSSDLTLPLGGLANESLTKRRDAKFKIRYGQRTLQLVITTTNNLTGLAAYIDHRQVERLSIEWKTSSSQFRTSRTLIKSLIHELSRITSPLSYLKIRSDGMDWEDATLPRHNESSDQIKSALILGHHWHRVLERHHHSLRHLIFNNRAGPLFVIDLLNHLPSGLRELDLSETDGTHHRFVSLLLYRISTCPELKSISLCNTSLMPHQRFSLFDGLKKMGSCDLSIRYHQSNQRVTID
eukprot:GHVH01004432.1.p1 GENE.GHVH01004432.1~~GHVH01004432.1.p1  ORF type:complete len:339 (+),score=41.68 GHVH01004432.1:39-1055(+)